uniref:Uncharacterized protein n=1 Tax=Glossina pallidipes TaxID=7398 RepID=A0A1B0A545_GLOPL
MATSPTPSLDSIRGIETTFIEHNGYLSDSPLTLSGSSPPVSDSAICDDYTSTVVVGATVVGQHHPISASVSSTASSSSSSSASSSSSSSGLSGCGSTSSNTSNVSSNSGGNGNVNGGVGVATGSGGPAHEFMHCFHGHNIFLFKGFEPGINIPTSGGGNTLTNQTTTVH